MKIIHTGKRNVIFDEEFENIFIDLNTSAFHDLGFSFGDSISLHFDDGRIIEDIPYYSGYYSGVEELMLCGYPGDPYIKIARNCGNPTWHEFHMHSFNQIDITLQEKGKYKEIEELFSLSYSDNPNDYPTLESYCNFRELTGGKIKGKAFYRSASPCDNWHNRAEHTDQLVKQYDIHYVLNLSNSEEKYTSFLERKEYSTSTYHSLYQNNHVLLVELNVNYRSLEFKRKIARAFVHMIKHQQPVLIHCAEGKDRTGFVSALILALASSNYNDILSDYMLTYQNYYGITKDTAPKKYAAILENIIDFLYSMCEAERTLPIHQLDLHNCAKQYLLQGGISEASLEEIIDYICI